MNEIMNVEPTRDVGLSGRGPVAYDFAPRRLRRGHGHDHASDEEEQDSVPVPAPPVLRQRPAPAPSRLTQGVERWCECACCQRMPSEIENVCCREVKFEKMTIPEDATCITHHEDFEKVCLSPAVLEMAMVLQRDVQGFHGPGELSNKRYRYTAYRGFTAWCHGHLGKKNRRVIPACVVSHIRRLFPEDCDAYTGFKGASEIEDALQ